MNFRNLRHNVIKKYVKEGPPLYYPDENSALMKKNGMQFFYAIADNKILYITQSEADNCPLALEAVNLSEQQLAVQFILTCIDKKMCTTQNVMEKLGFDADAPPDQKYLQLLFYKYHPDHLLMTGRKSRIQVKPKPFMMKAFFEQVTTEGIGSVDLEHTFSKEVCFKIRSEASAYMLLKFKMKQLHDSLEVTHSDALNNPRIRMLVDAYSVEMPALPAQNHQMQIERNR